MNGCSTMTNRHNAKTNVVITCWNALEYTIITINSLLKTVHGEYFLTIIDNASSDGTVLYLKKLKKPKKCVKLTIIYNKSNIGPGGATNQGYKVSKKYALKYTCLCNNDVFFQNNWLDEMEKCMESKPDIAALGAMRPSLDVFDLRTKKSLKEIVDCMPKSYTPQDELLALTGGLTFEDFCSKLIKNNRNNIQILACPPESIVTCCALIKNQSLSSLDYLADPMFESYGGEDIDLSWRLCSLGYNVAILNKIYVHHFRHKSIDASNLNRSKSIAENNEKLYKKWKNEILYFLKVEKNKIGSLDSLFNDETDYRYFFLRRINDTTCLYKHFKEIEPDLVINEVDIDKPIGNLYRKNHVLILVKDKTGRYILGQKKDFYAQGMSRMLGGGLNDNEDPREACSRELLEETKIMISPDNLLSFGQVITKTKTTEGVMYMNVHLFGAMIDSFDDIVPSDDISGVKSYSENEIRSLIAKMNNLDGEFRNDKFYFLHKDWGSIYGFIHEVALNKFARIMNVNIK